MNRYTLHLALHLQGPVLSRSTKAGAYGIDTPMAESPDGKSWCLPNTLIKGRLVEALRDLAKHAPEAFAIRFENLHKDGIKTLFGEASHQSDTRKFENVDPRRGSVHFTDFLSPKESVVSPTRTRTAIDPSRGAVDEGAMQVIESPFRSGQPVTFSGSLDFTANDQTLADKITDFLMTGFRWLCQLGGMRGIGFGRMLSVDHRLVARNLPEAEWKDEGAGLNFVIRPSGPLCIAPGDPRQNAFRSGDTIPGEMIIGAIAETWKQTLGESTSTLIRQLNDPAHATLAKHFDKIGVSHAFPSPAGAGRPVVPPLSLAKVTVKGGGEKLVDLWKMETPDLIDGEAPAFRVDWKDSADVLRNHGWPLLKRELRVHNAVNKHHGDCRRRAENAKLFSLECIIPEDHVWCGRINLNEVPEADRPQVRWELADLLAKLGLRNLSKTKQVAEIQWESAASSFMHSSSGPTPEGQFVITLQTLALLADPRFQKSDGSRERQLQTAYSAAWKEISGNSLTLSHFFASQRLFGGNYFYKRFQMSGTYVPLLLTEPGSVFVLKVAENQKKQAQDLIDRWLTSRLPLPQWAIEAHGDTWDRNTFLPQHGYGEIAINLHLASQPEASSDHE